MKVLSLFDGISGCQQALNNLAIGNSFTVPVIEHILSHIFKYKI